MSVRNNLMRHFLFYKRKRKLVVHALFRSGFVQLFRLKKRERLNYENTSRCPSPCSQHGDAQCTGNKRVQETNKQ